MNETHCMYNVLVGTRKVACNGAFCFSISSVLIKPSFWNIKKMSSIFSTTIPVMQYVQYVYIIFFNRELFDWFEFKTERISEKYWQKARKCFLICWQKKCVQFITEEKIKLFNWKIDNQLPHIYIEDSGSNPSNNVNQNSE